MSNRLRFAIAAAILGLIAIGAAGWVSLAGGDGVWTDGGTIRTPATHSEPRRVLWQPATPVAGAFENDVDAYEPRVSPDGSTLLFVRRRAGENADIVVSDWTATGWSNPRPIEALAGPAEELGPEFAPDGAAIYFYSDRPGGFGGYDLWVARREGERWLEPVNLGPAVNSAANEYGPAIAPDGRTLFFASNRPRAEGAPVGGREEAWDATLRERRARRDYDLYRAPLLAEDIGVALPIDELNTDDDEGSPVVSPSGDFLYFASDRPGGLGGYDLYRCRLTGAEQWRTTPLDAAVNSPSNELDPGLASDGFRLYFSSDRPQADRGTADGRYTLWSTTSREVWLERSDVASWAGLWASLWPWLLLVALGLLLVTLIALVALILGKRGQGRLSLLARCALVSLLLHCVIASLMAIWRVGSHVGELLASGGTRVVLASSASAADLTAQIRGVSVAPDFAWSNLPPAPLAPDEAVERRSDPPTAMDLPLPFAAGSEPWDAPSVPALAAARPGSAAASPSFADDPIEPAAPPAAQPARMDEVALQTDARALLAITAPVARIDPTVTAPPQVDSIELPPLPALTSPPAVELSVSSSATPSGQAIPLSSPSDALAADLSALPSAPQREASSSTEPSVATVAPLPATPPHPAPRTAAHPTKAVDLPLPAAVPGTPQAVSIAPAAPPPPPTAGPAVPSSDFAAALRLPELPAPLETFAQRDPEQRADLLEAMGGTPETEAAVGRALEWLRRAQSDDGRWGARAHEAEVDADAAMTGLALLAYLGAGHTHHDDGPYRETMARGIAWLTGRQAANGDLRQERDQRSGAADRADSMYGQTVAAVALCEAYAMTRDPALADPARRAVDFVLEVMEEARRGRAKPEDTSVLGWIVMTVESARRAGFDPPPLVFDAARQWLDSVERSEAPGCYSYRPGAPASVAMSAEAMFVRQILGHPRTERRMAASAEYVLTAPPRWSSGAPTNHWYYATLALFQQQGEAWQRWNEALVPELLAHQRSDGAFAGSWDPQDRWSHLGGRVYQTAICALSLEVYYRYRPR